MPEDQEQAAGAGGANGEPNLLDLEAVAAFIGGPDFEYKSALFKGAESKSGRSTAAAAAGEQSLLTTEVLADANAMLRAMFREAFRAGEAKLQAMSVRDGRSGNPNWTPETFRLAVRGHVAPLQFPREGITFVPAPRPAAKNAA